MTRGATIQGVHAHILCCFGECCLIKLVARKLLCCFLVELRRQQLEKQREEALLVEAYVALGGNADRDAKIKSQLLRAVASDFVGAGATSTAMDAVVTHKMKAVQEILGMGGSLDEEEEEELKDTTVLQFEELAAFAQSLHDNGADPAGGDDGGGEDGALR